MRIDREWLCPACRRGGVVTVRVEHHTRLVETTGLIFPGPAEFRVPDGAATIDVEHEQRVGDVLERRTCSGPLPPGYELP